MFYSLVLPCPGEPPGKPEGGWFYYNIEFGRYKCPNGYEFAGGNYPYWYSNCTMAKKWDPPEVEACVRKFLHVVSGVKSYCARV